MKVFLKENSLSIVLFGLFLLFLVALSVTGHHQYNNEALTHDQLSLSYIEYLKSGAFLEAVFENWESEFLQMWALVVMTIFLRQKGSADSKKIDSKNNINISSRYSIIRARSVAQRSKAIKAFFFAHSLGTALLGLFIVSICLHAISGLKAHNEELSTHGEAIYTLWQYVSSAQFWFESFQNWQSEFLAVGSLLVLSIFLREQGSPESKSLSDANTKTG